MTYLWIHLSGTAAALVLQLILVGMIRSNMAPIFNFLDKLNLKLAEHGLYYNRWQNLLVSRSKGTMCQTYSDLTVTKIGGVPLLLQCLIFSWLNFILIGLGFLTAIAQSKEMRASFVEYIAEVTPQLEEPEELNRLLKQLMTTQLEPRSLDVMTARRQVHSFIDEHF